MTNSIEEIRDTDMMFVIGSNTSEAHPIIAMEMKQAVKNGSRLIVADPRAIWMTGIAEMHLQLRPGTDVWLLNAMAHVIVTEDLLDHDFIHHEDRLTTPLVRGDDGELHEASWEEAVKKAAEGLLGVKERHGADSLGFVSSSRCTGEENFLMQKVARAAYGTNNVHSCAAT